jgi:dTDP-glucose pyrophosphorylase
MINDFNKHTILDKAPMTDALHKLNNIPLNLTLFALNNEKQLVGTLTDGDVRRGLLRGLKLEDPINKFMTTRFHSLSENNIDVDYINFVKRKGIKLLPVINTDKKIIKVFDLNILRSVLPLEAMLMAGGRGERLKPLTDNTPKPLLPLGNKPIIEHNIDRLIEFGVDKIYISVRYLADKLMDYLGDGRDKGIEIQYIIEDKPLGTIGSLSEIDQFHRDILVMNSDVFTNIDFEDLYRSFIKNNADMAVASFPYTINIPYAILEVNRSRIMSLREKPNNTYQSNAGIYIIKKEIVQQIPKNKFYNATDFIDDLLVKKKKIIHNPIMGYWIDIGKHEDYNKARDLVKHI